LIKRLLPAITTSTLLLKGGHVDLENVTRGAMSRFKDFMNSDAGARARYQKCEQQRVHIHIDDIEPQSKRMSDADRDKFQEAVAA